MQTAFERFLERLSESVDETDLLGAMTDIASRLDLLTFAYLSQPIGSDGNPTLISNYPAPWTERYFENQYQSIDPVFVRARCGGCLFRWGFDLHGVEPSMAQRRFFEEAAQFGIRCGVTIPIVDLRGNFAAMTFAVDRPDPAFFRVAERYEQGLSLIATCFHMFVRRKLSPDRVVDGILLTAREYECLQWAEKGKSAPDIGCILGIARHAVAFHLANTRRKLGVSTTKQAVARLAASSLRATH
ncbi:LuxR family transcriptional regulator [Mesorhizobium sp. M1A.F.Ca.IN.020.30.1.1]|uniref:LuxR family transcriptional regulator n=1 Tax=unclassified Mesorhizobium TaxID=325217 RepID=UPI000FD43FE0|nr:MULTISPECIES: LuxR family transcriptional regulator [unclassified Mesorhizobium]RUV67536.1 LuxR family transcriptional regulator [Mesorhizobium sp. M1A.F.Ca.IN.020.30.1.1]RWG39484.1 MAG: LuxR family transcriptional regulator [Mesorhizobium sp.]RWG65966.1 MAG: LuxR family transcriptional regulator [Mesorhizobium sp.]TIM72055.1 MAG: LuxR family transcriptional regulator [Mesorhizobium sp.]TIM83508.1 MAG: LuxR family transcriptional regulator [Mesorhizobium sp.]